MEDLGASVYNYGNRAPVPDYAFRLRLRLYAPEYDPRTITVTAFDDLGWDHAGRVRLTCEVRHGSEIIFPRGQLTCALHGASDGIKARELILALVAMRPGDTDDEYFEDYTPAQLAWATEHGDAIGAERERRYCDHNGRIRD